MSRTTALVAFLAAVLLSGCTGGSRGVAAPEPLPQLEPGLVEVVNAPTVLPGAGATTPGDGRLITPHSALRVQSTWTTDTLDALTGGPFGVSEESRPAEGEELLVVLVSARDIRPTYAPVDSQTGDPVAATAVVVDGVASPVELVSGWQDFAGAWLSPDAGLLLSVPVGAPVTLSVTDAERTASIDLRTGERVEDEGTLAGAPYYRSVVEQLAGSVTVDGPFTAPGYLPLNGKVTIDWDDQAAYFSLQPWTPASGWAPAGRVWGTAQVRTALQTAFPLELQYDPAQVFTLTPAGGQPLPAASGAATVDSLVSATRGTYVRGQWDLPADFTTGTLDVVLRGQYLLGDEPFVLPGEPALTGLVVDLTS